ncbi:MAG: hypothetical protein RBT74_06725 [Tenuifilaceae bacterium]|jgi:hypothetical protein|nr:hypothetical protein [Tenuifilaceae bacterium]
MSKGKHFTNQMQIVRGAWSSTPKTMLQVSKETGILRANICRYVAKWKRTNRIILHGFGLCPISKHRAGYYSTNLKAQGNG